LLVATGPIEEQWSIAQGSLKGVIYYNTTARCSPAAKAQ